MKKILLHILLVGLSFSAFGNHDEQHIASKVLDRLYSSHGDFSYEKPDLKVTNSDDVAALYIRYSNTIELSLKAYKVCQSFEQDSLDALAFILGHELAHVYEENINHQHSNFLACSDHIDGDVLFEESADIQGVFMANLANYSRSAEIMSDLIEAIYLAFNVEPNSIGYPSLAERKKTKQKTKKMVKELIDLYDAANYLVAIGEYELAVTSYIHISKRYQGRELLNNLGLAMALSAMSIGEKNFSPFIYPFEISLGTRMRKPIGTRGDELTAAEFELRASLLKKSETFFERAHVMDQSSDISKINLLTVKLLQGKVDYVVDYIARNELVKKQVKNSNKYRLLYSLANIYLNEYQIAVDYLNFVEKNGNDFERFQANFNKSILNERAHPDFSCNCPHNPIRSLPEHKFLHRQDKNIPIKVVTFADMSNIQVELQHSDDCTVYLYSKNDKRVFVMKKLDKGLDEIPAYNASTLFTKTGGGIVNCKEEQVAYLVDSKDQVKEMLFYFSYSN